MSSTHGSPVKVRLNRSLFPADLITIRVTGRRVLDGVELGWQFADETLKVNSGDGESIGRLTSAQSIDIFVHEGRASRLEVPGLNLTYLREVRRDNPFLIKMTWSGVDGDGRPGHLHVAWSYEDRRKDLRPRIAYGKDAEVLEKYVRAAGQPVTGALLRLRGRVELMSRRDILQRYRSEKKGSVMDSGLSGDVRATALSTRGYRGFRQEATLRLAIPNEKVGSGLTIVVGANNAGKSTIWESFDAIARKFKSDISFSEGRRNRQTPDGIRITLARGDGSTFVVESQNANTSETKKHWEPETINPATLEIVSVPSRRQFQASFGKNWTSQRDWMTSGSDFSRYRQPDNQFTGRLFDLHNDPAKKEQFDKLMTRVLGEPLDWTIDLADGEHGSSYYIKVTTGERVNHTSEGLGDGIISLLFILNALYDSEPDTLLVLDEPELSLHPQLVRRLGRELAEYSRTRQIVIFTHSPALISWDDIANGAEIARVYKTTGDSHIAQVPRATIDELSKMRGGWRNPHVLGTDAKEALFLDDEIIVVEGQDDVGLLPRVFEQTGVEPRGTIFGWGAGGGDGGPRRIVALLYGLGFSKVVVLLDADKVSEVEAIQQSFAGYFATTIPADDIRDKAEDHFAGKEGLLDKHGKTLKTALKPATEEVLQSVVDYFAHTDPMNTSAETDGGDATFEALTGLSTT
ncbi:MAG TPA: AAA family ATPase [Galbitalea sp.]|jgi:predicted ATPase|nr:AAA family ATPase [Galbitalea sp.]